MPPPVPPRVKRGAHQHGVADLRERGLGLVQRVHAGGSAAPAGRPRSWPRLKRARSSAMRMASRSAPISSHAVLRPGRPLSASSTARFRPVWPPTVGSRASGCSRGDDLLDQVGGERLDVGGVGQLGVGHDRGRVGVDQHHAVALAAQHLAGLHAGVVELAALADGDGAGARGSGWSGRTGGRAAWGSVPWLGSGAPGGPGWGVYSAWRVGNPGSRPSRAPFQRYRLLTAPQAWLDADTDGTEIVNVSSNASTSGQKSLVQLRAPTKILTGSCATTGTPICAASP